MCIRDRSVLSAAKIPVLGAEELRGDAGAGGEVAHVDDGGPPAELGGGQLIQSAAVRQDVAGGVHVGACVGCLLYTSRCV